MPLDPYGFRDFDNWQVYLLMFLSFLAGMVVGTIIAALYLLYG